MPVKENIFRLFCENLHACYSSNFSLITLMFKQNVLKNNTVLKNISLRFPHLLITHLPFEIREMFNDTHNLPFPFHVSLT